MTVWVLFAVVLLAALLVSEFADRSVLSTAVMFLLAGFVAGEGVLDLVVFGSDSHALEQLSELALFAVLFTDGMRVGVRDLISAWRLPGRALLLGMPLTFGVLSLLAHYVAGLPWVASFLVGAILSPTDPVFAAAIVGKEGVPARLRRLLNVESGLNDGLALPLVVALLAVAAHQEVATMELLSELGFGAVVGVVVPYVALRIEGLRWFSAAEDLKALFPAAIGILVFVLAEALHVNLFLAAFAAGVTLATSGEEFMEAFHGFGELIAELLKLGAVMVFGALVSPAFLAEIPLTGYVFAVLALFLARPVGLGLALVGSELSRKEGIAAVWFGPKGFASVVYGLLVVNSGIGLADEVFHIIAIVVALSIILHSSTDVMLARQLGDVEHR